MENPSGMAVPSVMIINFMAFYVVLRWHERGEEPFETFLSR
jgi:hypothetical protein